jgi:uncharacterized damage-inducible protein DinB
MSFLEEEREAFRPYERLLELSDDDLIRPVEAAHGWSGRDLMGHIAAWHTAYLEVARELAVHETSKRSAEIDADWDRRGGDVVNAELLETWARRPLSEVRELFRTVPGELRGTLTVVPETRWLKNGHIMGGVLETTIDHYEEHAADLAAVLAAAGRARA